MKKCEKCGYEKAFLFNKRFLCSVCRKFAPENTDEYINEKIDWKILDTFRKFENNNLKGMEEKARGGGIVTRPPLGYKIIDKELIPDP